jgi:hypothetical protein
MLVASATSVTAIPTELRRSAKKAKGIRKSGRIH